LAAIPLGLRPGFRMAYLLTLPLIATALLLSWQGWPSIFAALAMAGLSLGRYQVNVLVFRIILLATIPCWVAHNLLVGSLPGLFSDALVSTASIIGLWQHRRRRQNALVPVHVLPQPDLDHT
ncbi:MAG: YgjV family protein, partial [Candidatus Cloacimonetes bacterium]|nr:YgjV family protein [Candidatus Cloacimonadota bacterium]